MKKLVIGLVLVACVTVGAYPSANRAPSTRIVAVAPCLAPTDTLQIRSSWNPVEDRRGDPVAAYVESVFVNGERFDTDTLTGTSTQRSFPCPQWGDSVALFSEVFAIDNRGNNGDVGRSNTLVVRTPDRGPVAPIITIDTISMEVDSIQLYAVGAPKKILDYFKTHNVLGDGYSIQMCPVLWKDGVGTVPADFVSRCVQSTGQLRRDGIHYSTQRFAD